MIVGRVLVGSPLFAERAFHSTNLGLEWLKHKIVPYQEMMNQFTRYG